MDIRELHENWTVLGKSDPMWAGLTAPEKRGNRWGMAEFFETGRREIMERLAQIQQQGIQFKFGRALDFGCGLGRLSQALAEHFEKVDGVDISTSMIERAKALNQHPTKVSYHLNVKSEMSDFARNSYDFIFSVLVLQHMPAKLQFGYLSEFMQLLKPSGVACFQVVHSRGWRQCVPDKFTDIYRKLKHRGKAHIPTYPLPMRFVVQAVAKGGGEIRYRLSTPCGEEASRFISDTYFVSKVALKHSPVVTSRSFS